MKRSVAILALLAAWLPDARAQKWTVYTNCVLEANAYNDADSFHVKCKRRGYIFRLYFADAPESSRQAPARVAEQAEYWNLSEKDVLAAGAAATRFTQAFLKEPFTVYTRREDARGQSAQPRYYAMVNAGGRWLCEALVENGWARSYGMRVDSLPDGADGRVHRKLLDQKEIKARRAGVGMWSARSTGLRALLERRQAAGVGRGPPPAAEGAP